MNMVFTSIEIYLLIGLLTALVMARFDARKKPVPMPWGADMLPYAVVVILFWGWLLINEASGNMTEHLDG